MKWLLLTLLMTTTMVVKAQSCVGTWITIDDETGKKKSKVELYKKDSKLYGKIVYLYPREGREENPKCKKCTDDRKNQPLMGLQIVRGLEWDGGEWEDGTICDPENGKVYTCAMWLDSDNKDRLNVRGYMGPFFRTQTWIRVAE
jgi:uncharacterized protein (DUF2147 family)